MAQLIEYGRKGTGHWIQITCKYCGAWLQEMPDRYEKVDDRDEPAYYKASWTCLACGNIREEEFCSHPDSYTHDEDAILYEPGSRPDPVVRDPSNWPVSEQLTKDEKDLVAACWKMIDELSNEPIIHQISYLLNLSGALKEYDIEKVKNTAGEYVEMLDYELVHGQRPSSYGGTTGNVTDLRRILKSL